MSKRGLIVPLLALLIVAMSYSPVFAYDYVKKGDSCLIDSVSFKINGTLYNCSGIRPIELDAIPNSLSLTDINVGLSLNEVQPCPNCDSPNNIQHGLQIICVANPSMNQVSEAKRVLDSNSGGSAKANINATLSTNNNSTILLKFKLKEKNTKNHEESALTKQVYITTKYDLSYNLNGGVFETSNPSYYTDLTEDFMLKNPTRKGYTFAGWTGTELNGTTKNVIVKAENKGDRSYTAQWTKNQIPANLSGGTSPTGDTTSFPWIAFVMLLLSLIVIGRFAYVRKHR